MHDYDHIARVIRYLDEHHTEQPDLATLAKLLGLSLSHFQRLFSDWAGSTPKDFLQCLTLAHAKRLLRQGARVLDASLISALPGPSGLHDLRVTLEAASPDALQSGGKGWTISGGIAESPFGRCLVGESPRGICHLSFVSSRGDQENWTALQKTWPRARRHRDDSAAALLAHRIFTRPGQSPVRPALPSFVQGSPFQIKVWRALLHVPPGALVSYGQLASAIGLPRAARAVGTAVGQNPLAYIVPCHRVIRASGVLGDYHWGSDRKRALVAWESAPRSTAEISG